MDARAAYFHTLVPTPVSSQDVVVKLSRLTNASTPIMSAGAAEQVSKV